MRDWRQQRQHNNNKELLFMAYSRNLIVRMPQLIVSFYMHTVHMINAPADFNILIKKGC